MATALTLVNRVRRKLDIGETTTFTDLVSKRILDELNAGVAAIFDSRDWDCDVRHDGVLTLTASDTTLTGVAVTNESSTATWTSTSSLDAYSDQYMVFHAARLGCPRLVVENGDVLTDTAIRLVTYTNASPIVVAMELGWPGATATGLTGQLVCNEYVLPTTVRKILSMRHQEKDIRIEEVGRFQEMDRLVQRPHETISDDIEVVYIGGMATRLYVTGGSVPAPGVAMLVYPTPATTQVLHYSYLMKRAEMTATTDTLDYADRALEDFVVQIAYSRSLHGTIKNAAPGTGFAIESRVMNLAKAHYANQGKDPSRRRVIGSNFSDKTSGVPFGRWPHNFGTGT